MPRLVGKQSHTGQNVASLLILATILGITLEYLDVINVVRGFGDDNNFDPFQSQVDSK